jgi:ABC-2 type transport system permease protein
MVWTIASFEFHQRLHRISTYVYFLVFLLLGVLFAAMSGGAIPNATLEFGTGGKVLVNSPYALNAIISYVAFFGLVITAAIAGQATYQDTASNSTSFFYTSPITKFDYLAGRYVGALLIQLAIFSSVGIGAWIGVHLPWLDPTRVGPNLALAYLQPYFLLVIPNLILTSAIFFGLAALTRRMLAVYAGSVILLIAFFIAAQLSSTLTATKIAALSDPLGGSAIDYVTRYWTPFDRNTRLIPLQSFILLNRALWLGIGAAVLALTYRKFQLAYPAQRQKKLKTAPENGDHVVPSAKVFPAAHSVFSRSASFRQLISLSQIQFTETVKNVFFGVLLLAGFLFAVITANNIISPFTAPTYPVTYSMLESATGGFFIFAFAIIIFASGELVWRERDAQLNQIVDALPLQRWVLFFSKLIALLMIQVIIVLVIMAAGVVVQASHGYYRFEFGLYFTNLFGIVLIRLWILCSLAMLVHTIINNKYLGHFVMVLYLIASLAMGPLGLEDYLYRYGQAPNFIYSDMNRFGPYAKPLFWFELYWGLAAILLAIVSNLLWVRGTEATWAVRRSLFAARLSLRSLAAIGVCLLLFTAVGGYIFYNTHILNPYRNTFAIDEARAQYEKKYRQYKALPEPRITDLSAHVDLYPEQEYAVMHGTITLENKTNAAMEKIALTVWPVDLQPVPMPHLEIQRLSLAGGQTAILEDPALGFYVYKLANPLAAHARIALEFALKYSNVGFENSRPNTDLAHNGTLLGDRYMPFVGYAEDIELTDDSTRHKHGLDKVKRLPKLDDLAARNINAAATDADWITFEGTVSTSPDQIAVMPGYLQKEWTENGRRYFQYRVDAPILPLLSLDSARYEVRRDRWKDVNLEIYYHPGHEFDLDQMIDSMKASLEYCSTNFSPYQFRQLRILEFPRYATFAAAFANTVPFSEAIGFITYFNPKKPDSINLPFYVTAHETAHQWWGHQVMSANVEGQTSIVETLAQYSALMIMKHRFGDVGVKKFLRFELDRYLRGRAQERNEELPLYRVDSNQGYIHYNKGALVMYAVQDYVGEDKVNQALAAFVKKFAFQGPPYPVSTELIEFLKQVTPAEYQYLYDDLWENITLYDNRTKSAKATKLPDGKYQVKLVVDSKKLRSDGKGQEHQIPEHDWIDIGVVDANGKYLYLQKHKIEKDESELTIAVDHQPTRAGIDPLDKLIDRAPDDNMADVKVH